MGLDGLYGAGTAAAFAARVDLGALFPGARAAITEADVPDNSVHVEVTWRVSGAQIGRYRLDYWREVVHCSALEVEPRFQGKGLMTALMLALEPWWPTLGLRQHTMSTRPGSVAERALRSAGFHDLSDGTFGSDLPATGNGREYLDWVRAGQLPAQEPQWRAAFEPVIDVF